MKMEVGYVIEVEGREGVVVHTTVMDGKDYALVTYEEGDNKISYKVFEVKYEDNDFYVNENKDEELVSDILVEFTKEHTILGEE